VPPQITAPVGIDPATLAGHFAYYDPSAQGWTDGQSLTGLNLVNQADPGTRDMAITGAAYYRAGAINGRGAISFEGGSSVNPAWFPGTVTRTISIVSIHAASVGGGPWTATSFVTLTPGPGPRGSVMPYALRPVVADPRSRSDGWGMVLYSQRNSGTWDNQRGAQAFFDMAATAVSNSGGEPGAGSQLKVPYSGTAKFARLHFFDRTLTWGERFGISAWSAQTYGVYSPLTDPARPPLIICVGNSTSMRWPESIAKNAALSSLGAWAVSFASSGGNWATIDLQYADILECATAARTLGIPVVVAVHTGHNDGYGATTINSIKSATFQSLRAMGAKLFVSTGTPWNENPLNESGRTIYNGWLRGESPYVGTYGEPTDYIDAIGLALGRDYDDAPANTVISRLGKYSSVAASIAGSKTTYPALWEDNVHPTAAGAAAQVEMLAPDVAAVIAAGPPGLIDPKAIAVGATTATSAALTCPAASGGMAPYTYQWSRDGSPIAGATGQDLVDGGLAPSTAYSYVRRATDAGGYWRDSPAAEATTEAAGPSLAATASAVAVSPTAASLTCSASGGTEPYSYQWSRDGSTVAGATTATYPATGLTPGSSHAWTCAVADGAGGTTTADAGTVVMPTLPTVSIAIGAVTATTIAATATAADGIAPRSLQWTLGGWDAAGKTGASVTLDGLDPSTLYAVGCRVTDSSAPPVTAVADSEDVTTTAASTPIQIGAIAIVSRTSTTITVAATTVDGHGATTWQWYANDVFYELLNAATVTFAGLSPDTSYTIRGEVADESGADEMVVSSSTLAEAPTGDAAAIAAAVWSLADGIEPGETPRQTMRLLRAVLAGNSTGGANPTFARADGTTTALSVALDGSGGRTASTPGDV